MTWPVTPSLRRAQMPQSPVTSPRFTATRITNALRLARSNPLSLKRPMFLQPEKQFHEMHREPTKCKLPLCAAGSAPGSRPGFAVPRPSSSCLPEGRRCLHPGWRRRPEADCAGRGHQGPERRPLTEARGSGKRTPAGLATETLTGRGAQSGLIQGHLRPGRTGPDGAVTERASLPACRPVPLPPTARASAVLLPPDGVRGPQLRRMPPPGPHPFPRPPPPLHPFPPPPSPRPHQNGKYLPGRGAAGARLSEGQPTVTNSRRGSGGAGFLVANPKACR